jgi:hypothetical protein
MNAPTTPVGRQVAFTMFRMLLVHAPQGHGAVWLDLLDSQFVSPPREDADWQDFCRLLTEFQQRVSEDSRP